MSKMYVYQYSDNGKVFYVGIGKNYRMNVNLSPSKYMPYDVNYPSLGGKIKSLILNNKFPKVEKIFEGSREECRELEVKLIKKYKTIEQGGSLYNISLSHGGRTKGQKYPMSEYTLKQYRETRRNGRSFKIEKEDLLNMYIEKNMTRKDVASHYNCSEVLVKIRLKEYGIKKQA
tara:strand:+ start:1616 stop:2137 length:522 start_codon:yes stop_codon:yes gene_type:complete